MMQSIGGVINDLVFFVILGYVSLVMSGKIKSPVVLKEKDGTPKQFSRVTKGMVYAATVLLGVLIVGKLFF
jgi:hypothetical protein